MMVIGNPGLNNESGMGCIAAYLLQIPANSSPVQEEVCLPRDGVNQSQALGLSPSYEPGLVSECITGARAWVRTYHRSQGLVLNPSQEPGFGSEPLTGARACLGGGQ